MIYVLIGIDGFDVDKIVTLLPKHIDLRGLTFQKAENQTRRKLQQSKIIVGIPEVQYFFRNCFAGQYFIEEKYREILKLRLSTRYRLLRKLHYNIVILVQGFKLPETNNLEYKYIFNPQVIANFLSFDRIYIINCDQIDRLLRLLDDSVEKIK